MTDPAPAAEKAEAAEKLEKRNRPPVSCEPCRQRKLKCNRGLPCDTCIRRNKQAVCQYASNARRGKPNIPSKQAQLQDKLKNLESLVSSLVTKQERPTSPAGLQSTSPFGSLDLSNRPSPAPSNKESPRPILAQNGQVSYVDPSHWQSVLEELKEVREQLSSTGLSLPSEPAPNPQSGMGGSDVFFLFADSGEADLEDILASIPSQAICDGLLSNYFNAPVTLLPIVHPEKFRMEYQDFWASPSDVNPLWLGMLFSILALSISLRQLSKGPDDSLPSPVFMQQRTVHCLVLGNYISASAYSLEAIILHMQSCFLTSRDTQSQLWLKMGHAIQLAFRMAYHRDPSKLPGISAFDGEMRRRVWMNLIQLDALGSFQIGLPSMVPNDYCDTRVPGNYEYTDLYPAMTSLPPPRPLNQRTPMLYTISKAHIMAIFKKITQHTQTLAETTYERTIALDLEMREAYATHIPQLLQRRAVNQSYMDATSLIWDRANIELLYLKGIIVLHRRYLRHEPGNPRFEPSRRHCVDAALETLARQADIGRASQPGGRLHEDRWMSGALAVYDFILAAMVVCLDLSMRMKSPAQPTGSDDIAAKELAALQVSQGIWSATVQASRSPEAVVAAKTIDLMLKSMEQRQQRGGNGKQEVSPTRAQQQQQQQQQGGRPTQAQSQYPHHMQQFHQQMLQQQQQAYNHPHMQQQQQPAQGLPPAYTAHGQTQTMPELPHTQQQQQQQQGQQPLPMYVEPMFSDMIDGSEPLDWSLLDQFFQNPSASAAGGGEGWEAAIGMGSASGGSGFDDLDM